MSKPWACKGCGTGSGKLERCGTCGAFDYSMDFEHYGVWAEKHKLVVDAHYSKPSRPVYMARCGCGRCNRVSEMSVGHIERVGWREMSDSWLCPFCSGNESNLRAAFGGEA